MNVKARLEQTISQLDEDEARLFNSGIVKVYTDIGLPVDFFFFLDVLDDRPWKDYKNSPSQVYARAGKEVLENVIRSCQEQRLPKELCPVTDDCLRRFQEYANLRKYEDFAVAVQNLVICLDELIISFLNRPRHETNMDQGHSIEDRISDLARIATCEIAPAEDEITAVTEKHNEDMETLQNVTRENWKKFEEDYGMTMEQYREKVEHGHEEQKQELDNNLKSRKVDYFKKIVEVCKELENGIKSIIKEKDEFRDRLKQERVNQLKPVCPPVGELNDLNRRCCQMFEHLRKLEGLDSNVDVMKNISNLQYELLKNAMVVELAPPPIVKLESKSGNGRVNKETETGKKGKGKSEKRVKAKRIHESKLFPIGVRFLGAASCPDLVVAADQLKFTAHIKKDQIEQAMDPQKEIDPKLYFCEVEVVPKKADGNLLNARSDFRRTFDIKLVEAPKPEDVRHACNHEKVTDMKCAIVMSVHVGKFSWIKVLCEPVVLTTASNQTTAALGTIFWDAAFSELKRNCYEEKTAVKWPELADKIRLLFNGYIPKRPLTDQQLTSIAMHLFKGNKDVTYENYIYEDISRELFKAQSKMDDSFWKWLFCCLNLIRKDPHFKNWAGLADLWEKGYILGFVTKEEAEKILKSEQPGTFLIRFRGTGIENCDKDCPRASLSVAYRKDEKTIAHVSNKLKATYLQSLPLGKALQQLKNGNDERIQYLYPAKLTFEEAFGAVSEEGSGDPGYEKLISMYVSLEKKRNITVDMGMDAASCQDRVTNGQHSTVDKGAYGPGYNMTSQSADDLQQSMQHMKVTSPESVQNMDTMHDTVPDHI